MLSVDSKRTPHKDKLRMLPSVDRLLLGFDDAVAGKFSQNVEKEVGDFVLKRNDGLYAYQLAVVVDDALMGITDVVRGMDLNESTPRQILLFEVLGVPIPTFWHVPLMRDDDGRRMSKRFDSRTIEDFRAGGGVPGVNLAVPRANVNDTFGDHRGGENAVLGGELPAQVPGGAIQRQHPPVD